MSKKFRVEISATRVLEVTIGEPDGLSPMEGERDEDAAEMVARENLFGNGSPDCCRDIESWDVTVESVTPIIK